MFNCLLLAVNWPQLWYAAPLIVAVSLVYSGTRQELMLPLLMHAVRTAAMIAGFMAVILGLLYWLSTTI